MGTYLELITLISSPSHNIASSYTAERSSCPDCAKI